MLQGYSFKGAAGAATIYDPILRAAVTTLPFRGTSRVQKLMGVSVAGDTPTFLNNIRVKIGNSLPDYRYCEINPNAFDADKTDQSGALRDLNYWDLGGLRIMEGETLTITLVGTGLFSGVLWVEDLEPGPLPIPNGNLVCLKCGGTNDAGTSIAVTGFDMDARSLEISRMYTPIMVETNPEDKVIEVLFLAAGKDVMTLPPCGRMVYPNVALQFTGMQYNAGHVKGYMQVQAATKADIRIWCVESAIPGGEQTVNGAPIQGITSANVTPGTSFSQIIGASSGKLSPIGGSNLIRDKPQARLQNSPRR